MTDRSATPPFHRIGPETPTSPVVLSVPHAGRAYDEALIRAARVPLSILEVLEDRLVDRLIWRAVAAGATAIVASAPRALIDLNRDERDMDPGLVAPTLSPSAVSPTARALGGLGLVPARLAGVGNLWRGRLSRDELVRRITIVHRPYHAALADALEAARRRFGIAVLLDCHSMPPRKGPAPQPAIVFGDRHGISIAPALLAAAVEACRRAAWPIQCNEPYAGGHIVERHGQPERNVHALQIEIDRSRYLDGRLKEAGPGFDAAARMLATISAAVEAAALAGPDAIAAE